MYAVVIIFGQGRSGKTGILVSSIMGVHNELQTRPFPTEREIEAWQK